MSKPAAEQKNDRIYCSEQGVGADMLGTADRVDVWLLLEYRGTWSTKALADADFGDSTRAWLKRTAEEFSTQGLRLRPQLIRQPEREEASGASAVRLFLSGHERCTQVEVGSYTELANIDLVEAFKLAPEAQPAYFVCTNGQRDLCCARFGLPVYRRLRDLVGDRVWQATHLGGHRYAPNVLVTPRNLLYGRVGVDDVEHFVAQVEAGRIDFARLRGRSTYPQAVQAAEGMLARQGLKLLRVDGASEEPGDIVTVEFADQQARHRVNVRRTNDAQMILASCGDEAMKPFHPFVQVPSPE